MSYQSPIQQKKRPKIKNVKPVKPTEKSEQTKVSKGAHLLCKDYIQILTMKISSGMKCCSVLVVF